MHFIGLVNVVNLKGNGLGDLGHEQLEWLERDVKGLSASTPIVVFAHVPLWIAYQEWGWGTADGAQALGYLKRFGSVTVLNGHIHQVLQKVEGHVAFHTARSTAFPQPAPGTAPSPGPMTVPAGRPASTISGSRASAWCRRRRRWRSSIRHWRAEGANMSEVLQPGRLARRVVLRRALGAGGGRGGRGGGHAGQPRG